MVWKVQNLTPSVSKKVSDQGGYRAARAAKNWQYPITVAWVQWPERLKVVMDKVKRLEGSPARTLVNCNSKQWWPVLKGVYDCFWRTDV